MTRPSLLANPIMGLTGRRSRARELLAHHHHVYFCDLREFTASGMSLTGRLFYGCVAGPATFTTATLGDTCFVCCAGPGAPIPDGDARQAIDEGLSGDWHRAWALLKHPDEFSREAIEHLVAVTAIGMLDAHWGVRLDTMTNIARFLREHRALLPTDTQEVLEAFLLYNVTDNSDMVFRDAAYLVDDLKVSPGALEHLVGRARSPDPHERIAALVARQRMHLVDTEVPHPPIGELLDDDDPDVQFELLRFLSQNAPYSSDVKDLLPGVDLPAKLNRFLRSPDDRVRRRAIHYVENVGGSANREVLIDTLRDPDETLRNAAFNALYQRLPQEERQEFLLHHEATPTQRAMVLEYEKGWRERFPGDGFLIEPDDLRAKLANDDPRQRREVLVLAGYAGDPALITDVERMLGDADPRVRAEAERLLPHLRDAQNQSGDGKAMREAEPILMAEAAPPPEDPNSATITVMMLAGGTAADDWVETLARMYTRWASGRSHEVGFVYSVLDDPKSTPRRLWFTLRGPGVFNALRGESGVHRLVAFDPQHKRRFVAFATVEVNSDFDGPSFRLWATPEDATQVRTYVLHPVPRVTDDRSGVVVDDAQAVLDGALDAFLSGQGAAQS